MLQSLEIENVAIIEKNRVDFTPGLNVLTGETGAGKSIIIDAINAVMGERTSKEIVRTGASSAKITAVFTDFPDIVKLRLDEIGIECDSKELIIYRTIGADSRGSCRINGVPVTVSMLRSVGTLLLNIHGQHDSQALLDPDTHCSFIDSLADDSKLLDEYSKVYEKIVSLKRQLSSLTMDEAEKSRQIDMLRFQINELEAAEIKENERDGLTAKRELYKNSEKVRRSLLEAYAAISGDDEYPGAASLASDAANSLSNAERFSEDCASMSEKIKDISYDLDEYAADIRRLLDSLEVNAGELADIEERLDLLYRLSKKYGETETDMLSFLENAKKELEKITLSDEMINELKVNIAKTKAELKSLAEKLSEIRMKTGVLFSQKVKKELEFLNMPGAKFEVRQDIGKYTPTGRDIIEFMLSANSGEELKPLAKTASGGELSRIMLAIKNVLSDKDCTGTLIFDEIDTGVSGSAAYKIGQKLRSAAAKKQVICVTHLPQIAVFAQNPILVEKSTKNGKTYTEVKSLDHDAHVREIARLTGNGEITSAQLNNAAEMLKNAAENT